ncbi:hypothetical protein BJ170DRAFT_618086 [Xylariales sp. AK1849]|nr:hypothetical protein BJ170DRAFT_618086 [Xylariales sp. AK1849]
MYSGFMTFGHTVMDFPTPIVNLPISGSEDLETIAKLTMDFKATAIISNVYISTRLCEYLKTRNLTLPNIRLLLFTGEAFYKDLRPLFLSVFPNLVIRPLSYGSVELKIIAFPLNRPKQVDADINPVYKVNSTTLIVEIIDNDGSAIKENGKPGLIFGTNLIMKLQPKIRYPVGDAGEWVEYEGGLFRFLGRQSVELKLANAHLGCHQIRQIVRGALGDGRLVAFQTVVRRSESQNTVTIRIAAAEPVDAEDVKKRIQEDINETSPAWKKRSAEGFIAPIRLEWCAIRDLVRIESSGKLREIVKEKF